MAAILKVTMAQFQAIEPHFGGPVVYSGSDEVKMATITLAVDFVFEFTPKPTEADFLTAYPSAIKVEGIDP